jgi:hypothetical protein
MRLHVLTACSHPENLVRVGASVAAVWCHPWEICWHVRFDVERQHVGGQALKNQMLDQITDGWVCFLDDDTVLHRDWLACADTWEQDMIVVSQLRSDGRVLAAAPENMRVGHVDIGQILVTRDAIGDLRIHEHYEGDGVFIAALAAFTSRVSYVPNVLSYHNALEPVVA